MINLTLFPAILGGIRSRKDKTFAITFDTNELSPEQSSNLMSNLNEFGYVAFKKESFNTDEKQLLDSLKADNIEDGSKTPSQRLRGVLYRNWEQENEGYNLFTDYYRAKLEVIITHFKGKLD